MRISAVTVGPPFSSPTHLVCDLPLTATVQEFSQWVFEKAKIHIHPRWRSMQTLMFTVDIQNVLSIERWRSIARSFSQQGVIATFDHLNIREVSCFERISSDIPVGRVILIECLFANRISRFASKGAACHWILKGLHSLLSAEIFRHINQCHSCEKVQENFCMRFLVQIDRKDFANTLRLAINDKRLPNAEVVLVASFAQHKRISTPPDALQYLRELQQTSPPALSEVTESFAERSISAMSLQPNSSVDSLPSLVDSLGPPSLVDDSECLENTSEGE